jgi:hypothetical protein
MHSRECENELDWTAFCYAAGEMNEAEAAAFESRLADDQDAREALARAVELTQVVASAQSLEPVVAVRSQSSRWSRRLGWMAIGSAASLLVALLWSGAGSWFGGETVASGEQSRLADAWSQTRQELADNYDDNNDSDLWYPKHASDSDAVNPPVDASELDSLESTTPAWLTAAVESYPNEPSDPDSTPFDGERSEN